MMVGLTEGPSPEQWRSEVSRWRVWSEGLGTAQEEAERDVKGRLPVRSAGDTTRAVRSTQNHARRSPEQGREW